MAKKSKCVKIIPLGGIGEIGKNMTAIEYDNDMIIIDAGIAFPTEETPGVDQIIPDITYVRQNKEKVKAILVTHGHEDHIGAMPFVMKEVDAPVYGTKLTIAFIESKLQENKLSTKNLKIISDGNTVNVGQFSVTFIKVSHSISGSVALVIKTPIGIIFHTGDFKIDFTPVDGKMMNLREIAEFGNRGVLLMLAESTNVEREGYTLSETSVGAAFDRIFAANLNNRIIIATFSSNIHRLQQIMASAEANGRKVILSGRSLIKNCEIAHRIGELNYPEGLIIDIDTMNRYPMEKLVIVSTGSQGEPMSVLTRMASGEFNKVKIQEKDTIIISASPIPGNERAINTVINNLYMRGANVIYEALDEIHVSGHACKEELKMMHALVNPRFFVPVHGEYRHLKQHAMMAESLGMDRKNILIPAIGNVIELTERGIRMNGTVPSGTTYIDGSTVGETDSDILSDRKKMSADGLIIVLISDLNDQIPDVIARGLMMSDDLTTEIKDQTLAAMRSYENMNINDKAELKRMIKRNVKKSVWNRLNKSPMIIPLLMEN